MLIPALAQRIGRLRRNESGAAAVEFALIMPFMLALYFGSMEASALFTADKRVNTISATTGDLVAQWDPTKTPTAIPQATLTGYFTAAAAIISPYASAGMQQVVSLVFVKSDGTTVVLWSVANGTGATARTVNQPFAPLLATSPTNLVARGGCIVAAETRYSYQPLLGQIFTAPLSLYHINYFIPRYGANGTIQLWNTSLSATACTTGS